MTGEWRRARPDPGAAVLGRDLLDPPQRAARRPVRRDRLRMMNLAAQQPGFLGVETARRHRDHGLVLGRRGVDRGLAARRRSHVRAVRRPHPLVRRVRAARRASRARAQLRPRGMTIPRPNASISTTARPALAHRRRRDAIARGRRESRPPEAVDAVGRRAVGRHDVPARPAPRPTHPRDRARSGSTACSTTRPRRFLGAFGLMTRRGPAHPRDRLLAARRRRRPRATQPPRRAALTDAGLALDGVDRMIIVCDEANRAQRRHPAAPRLHARPRRERARPKRRARPAACRSGSPTARLAADYAVNGTAASIRAITSSVEELGHLERGHVLAHLRRLARARDHGRHPLVLRAPRERQLRERATEIVGDDLQLAHLLVRLRVGEHALQPLVTGQLRAGVVGHAVEVLAA